MQGWIKLHRELLKSNVFQNEKLLKVFMYCLLKATHSNYTAKVGRQTVELQPGQFIYGRKKAALELDMKESTVRDYMKILKDDNTISMKSTNKFTVITIVKWGEYQNEEDDLRQQKDSKKTAEGQQKDTYKNGNNAKNEKELIPYKDIVAYLNELSDSNFKHTANKTKELIQARINEGHTPEDFKTVIEHCCKEWKGKTFNNGAQGDNYLRPSTLFNNKFDERLEQAKKKPSKPQEPLKVVNGGYSSPPKLKDRKPAAWTLDE